MIFFSAIINPPVESFDESWDDSLGKVVGISSKEAPLKIYKMHLGAIKIGDFGVKVIGTFVESHHSNKVERHADN
jgi:hypothetical protein